MNKMEINWLPRLKLSQTLSGGVRPSIGKFWAVNFRWEDKRQRKLKWGSLFPNPPNRANKLSKKVPDWTVTPQSSHPGTTPRKAPHCYTEVTDDFVTLCWAQDVGEKWSWLMNVEWPGISKERLGFVRVYGVEAQESQHHGTYVEVKL